MAVETTETFLILHGWGGNKPAHWQEHLYAGLTAVGKRVLYPKMPDPAAPDRDAWLARLREEMGALGDASPLTVVTHSLGAITWLHWAALASASAYTFPVADRVLLVAPPYVIPEIPPTDAPPGVPGFFPPPLNKEGMGRVGRETVFIASDSDDYATFEQTSAYATRLELPIYLLPGAGHISPYWGYGEWPWVLEWCLGNAPLPPLPRASE